MARTARMMMAAAVVALAAQTANAQSRVAEVYVVHGIPGTDLNQPQELRVDISVNGACAIQRLPYKFIAGPFQIPAGTQRLAVHYPATGTCSSAAVIGPAAVPFAAGEQATIIAHLGANGAPTASKFLNNLSATGEGRARVLVHHTANAPAVDVYLTNQFGNLLSTRGLITGFAPGEQGVLPLRGAPADLALTLPGGTAAVLGPAGLGFESNRAYLVYVVGSVANRTLDFIAHTVTPQ